jgi:chromosome segregation ATPase
LNLSRSQVRKLLEKFITRDSLYYRKITDKPATAAIEADPLQNIPDEQLSVLARGNKRIAEASNVSQSSANSEIVTVDGITVNVQQILNQMKRAESAYEESERIVADLRKNNSELKSTNHRNEKKIKDLSSDLKSYSRKLQDAESGLSSMTVSFI